MTTIFFSHQLRVPAFPIFIQISHQKQTSVVFIPQTDSCNKNMCLHQSKLTIFDSINQIWPYMTVSAKTDHFAFFNVKMCEAGFLIVCTTFFMLFRIDRKKWKVISYNLILKSILNLAKPWKLTIFDSINQNWPYVTASTKTDHMWQHQPKLSIFTLYYVNLNIYLAA